MDHNLAVTMGKKMDVMMSVLSEIKKKQDHLALELQQVCPPTPVTERLKQLCSFSDMLYTIKGYPWYMSDSFTDHTPKAGALFLKPAFKVATTTFRGCFHITIYCTRHSSLQIYLYCSDGGNLSHRSQGSIQDHPNCIQDRQGLSQEG